MGHPVLINPDLGVVFRGLEDLHDEVLPETPVEAGHALHGDRRRRVVHYLQRCYP